MDLTKVLENSVASLEKMLETVDEELTDVTRMTMYCHLLLIEYHTALSEELAKQGITL